MSGKVGNSRKGWIKLSLYRTFCKENAKHICMGHGMLGPG